MASDPVDPNGFIFGEILLKSGEHYRGIIRWGKEESSWGDLFHSSKGEVPFKAYIPDRCKEDRNIKVFGIKIRTRSWNVQVERMFVARFGDIREIRPEGSQSAEVLMKSGRIYSVKGHSNDVGTCVSVRDNELGTIEVPWKKIQKIVFSNGKLEPGEYPKRIYGTVETLLGTHEGFIQWDHDECISEDELDGENENGSFSIPFGNIQSILKKSNSTVFVTLKNGRKLHLRGANDVNKSNKGIYIDIPQLGRIDIPWRIFKKATFSWGPSTGPNYDSFPVTKPLKAIVLDKRGTRYEGFLAYDLDEMEGWEMLNGEFDDMGYAIPFQLIKTIKPSGSYAAQVSLRNGKSLTLEDRADVSRKNLGILILKKAEDLEGNYTPWDQLNVITFP
jgi:hypothetical protein